MARLAITIGLKHDSRKPVVITGPDVPLHVHRTGLQALQASPTNPDFCQVEIWSSDAGMLRRKKFTKPVAATSDGEPKNPSAPDTEPAKKPTKKK